MSKMLPPADIKLWIFNRCFKDIWQRKIGFEASQHELSIPGIRIWTTMISLAEVQNQVFSCLKSAGGRISYISPYWCWINLSNVWILRRRVLRITPGWNTMKDPRNGSGVVPLERVWHFFRDTERHRRAPAQTSNARAVVDACTPSERILLLIVQSLPFLIQNVGRAFQIRGSFEEKTQLFQFWWRTV